MIKREKKPFRKKRQPVKVKGTFATEKEYNAGKMKKAEYGEKSTAVTEFIDKKKLKKYMRDDDYLKLKPVHRAVINSYILYNGNITKIMRKTGLKRGDVSYIMRKATVRKSVKKLLNICGMDMFSAMCTVKEVMETTGDYHHDLNRLKAAEIAFKLHGAYAPKKVQHTIEGGGDQSKDEVVGMMKDLVMGLKGYIKEQKEKIIDAKIIET